MTQQPNQNFPQPGQGWGQPGQPGQQPQQQWGQPAAPAAPPYGAAAQPAQQWGQAAGTGYPAAGSASGSGVVGKAWALYAALAGAVIALASTFLDWGGLAVNASAAGLTNDMKIGITGFSLKYTLNGKSIPVPSTEHPTRIWGILIIVGAVVLAVGVVLAMLKKTKLFGWVTLGGAVVIGGATIGELLYLNSKLADAKKSVTNGDFPDGAKYTIGMHYGAYVGIAAALIAVVFAVLAALSITEGGAASAPAAYDPYGNAYGQPAQAAYGQPAQAAYGQPAAQQWGQPQPPQQQAWGGQQDAQPQGQQWGQPQGNPFDPANQPTQAVQQYPPQPPQ